MIDWKPVNILLPDENERVLVFNGVHVWDTHWRWAMADGTLVKAPVTHCAYYNVPYPQQRRVLHCTNEFEEKLALALRKNDNSK